MSETSKSSNQSTPYQKAELSSSNTVAATTCVAAPEIRTVIVSSRKELVRVRYAPRMPRPTENDTRAS